MSRKRTPLSPPKPTLHRLDLESTQPVVRPFTFPQPVRSLAGTAVEAPRDQSFETHRLDRADQRVAVLEPTHQPARPAATQVLQIRLRSSEAVPWSRSRPYGAGRKPRWV